MAESNPLALPGRNPSLWLRRSLLLGGLAGSAALGGCGAFSWFSSGKRKIPDLPALAGGGSIKQVWSVDLPGEVGFQPSIAGGLVFAASPDGTVACIEGRTGKSVWQVRLAKRLVGGVGADGRIAVVAARDGSLIALDSDGKQRWTTAIGAEVVTVPSVGEKLVVVRSSDNRVSAFDADTGERRWSFQRQGPALVLRQTSSIAIGSAQVYVGMPGGRMLALASDSGAQRWETAIAVPRGSNEIERIADLVGTPKLVGNDVCASAFQGRVGCLDVGTGRTLWSRELSSAAGIDADTRALVVCDEKGHIHAFSRSGSSLWRQEKLAGRDLSAPMLVSGRVLVSDSQGNVHLLGLEDGALLARFELGRPLSGAPVRIDQVALLQTRGGALHALAID